MGHHKPLFGNVITTVQKDEEDNTGEIESEDSEETHTQASSTDNSSHGTITVGQLRARSRAMMEKALIKRGYPKELLEDDNFRNAFAKALVGGGELVSKKTGKAWIDRSIPEEPPAFVRPDKIKLGDRVQVLNWIPMGVHGATIDLFPKGSVTKIYQVKCLVTKEPFSLTSLPDKSHDYMEEDRIMGLELDGKGPYPLKDLAQTPLPYILKDSSVIMRFPPMGTPAGQTEHVDPMVM